MAVRNLLAILVLQWGTIFSPGVVYWLLRLLFGLRLRLFGFLWFAAANFGASAFGLRRFPVFALWPGVLAFATTWDHCAILVRQVNAVFSEGQVIRLYRFLIECSLRVDDFFATTPGFVRLPSERIIKWPWKCTLRATVIHWAVLVCKINAIFAPSIAIVLGCMGWFCWFLSGVGLTRLQTSAGRLFWIPFWDVILRPSPFTWVTAFNFGAETRCQSLTIFSNVEPCWVAHMVDMVMVLEVESISKACKGSCQTAREEESSFHFY